MTVLCASAVARAAQAMLEGGWYLGPGSRAFLEESLELCDAARARDFLAPVLLYFYGGTALAADALVLRVRRGDPAPPLPPPPPAHPSHHDHAPPRAGAA